MNSNSAHSIFTNISKSIIIGKMLKYRKHLILYV